MILLIIAATAGGAYAAGVRRGRSKERWDRQMRDQARYTRKR